MNWTNVCVGGCCFAEPDIDDVAPCGASEPSPFCLSNNICPYFAWSGTTERKVAYSPPLRLILWDRLGIWVARAHSRLRWSFWGQLWFNRRKVTAFFDNIKAVTEEDFSMLSELHKEELENAEMFIGWFKKAQAEDKEVQELEL